MKRESFGSRIGFILVSAGCAIGIGNVWKFPYMCGKYGGAAFILIYLLFLVILCIPILVTEFAIGRGSKRSIAMAFDTLEPPTTRYHKSKVVGIVGNYFLMMFYTTVGGWMLNYCVRSARGDFVDASSKEVSALFGKIVANPVEMVTWTVVICLIGFLICGFGIEKGVEGVSKVMMSALLIIMVVLAVHSIFMKGAGAGIRFYLIPDMSKIHEAGLGNVVFAAMSQAYFTLSVGMGSMMIFGSYVDRKRRLLGESLNIAALDTFVALMSGFIIIPACFAYGVQPDAGPKLIFVTLPNLFVSMPGGRLWGSLFFLFLSFAAISTVIAVFENIISFDMDMLGWSRIKSTVVSAVLLIALSMPCCLGFNLWSGIQPFGGGSNIMDLEDFIVSNNVLPLGSIVLVLFCTKRNGWGWDAFLREANEGKGLRFPSFIYGYMKYCIPLIISVIYLKGYYDKFASMGTVTLICWMCFAVAILGFLFFCTTGRQKGKPRLSR